MDAGTIGSGAHLGYIAFAYLGVGVLVVLTIGLVVWDSLRVKARLAALEKAGIRRRSAEPRP